MPQSPPPLSDVELQREKARVAGIFRTLTQRELRFIPVWRLARLFNIKMSFAQIDDFRRKFITKAGEESMQAEKEKLENIDAQILVEDMAAIASKTFAHLGDAEKIGTEEGMQRIVRRLINYDPTILNRNVKRRLPK